MNGILGAKPERRRRAGIQQILAVVSGVLATDQVLKGLLSNRAGIERTLDPALWETTVAIVALMGATATLMALFRRGQLTATVVGLLLGGLTSVTIDTLAGATFEFGLTIGSIADLAVAAAIAWGAASIVLNRAVYRDPVVARSEHRLAA
jgi:hypothetical protein